MANFRAGFDSRNKLGLLFSPLILQNSCGKHSTSYPIGSGRFLPGVNTDGTLT